MQPSAWALAVCVTLSAAVGACDPALAQPRPRPMPVATTAPVPAAATACRTAADCVLVPQPAPSELAGGACCNVCAGYLARNRAWHAQQPTCDARTRGACPMSCAQGAPPPVACEAGRCVLAYPPAVTACSNDHECVSVPRLDLRAPEGACRLACGQYIAAHRDWDAWRGMLWQNASVTGPCPETCVERPLPSARCVAGQCALRPPTAVRTTRVDLRAPSANGPLTAAIVTNVITALLPQLVACRQRPRSVAPIGYVGFTARLTVGADGRVTSADTSELGNHLPDIAACMATALRGASFARTSAVTTIEYPMGAAFAQP